MSSWHRKDELAQAMYDRYQQGLSLAQVAEEFDRSPAAVWQMFDRRGWALRPRHLRAPSHARTPPKPRRRAPRVQRTIRHARPDGDLMDWAVDAACRDMNPDVFFPTASGPRMYDAARKVCDGCPVRDDCADYGLRTRQPYGMWGGLSPEDRERLLRGSA